MPTDRRIRFKVAWGLYPVGAVITPPATLRGWLIAQGFAQPYSEPLPQEVELAEIDPEPETVPATGKRRRART